MTAEEGARAGQLSCACPLGSGEPLTRGVLAALAAGFGLTILAQALVLSVLPEASRLMAPSYARIGWPFALVLIGAAAATFPAAFLIDAFGRRAALALGASLGAAGGLLAAHAIARGNFNLLCIGAFWLGLAQGFGLFYRHIAAQGSSAGAEEFPPEARAQRASKDAEIRRPLSGALAALSGGAAAALAAPLAAGLVQSAGGGAGATLIAAALLHIGALALSVRLPHALAGETPRETALPPHFLAATLAGALAWFVMAAAMLHGPLALAGCSAGPAFIGGAMAWHLLAMFGPAALAARWPGLFPPRAAIGGGLAVLLASGAVLLQGAAAFSITAAMLAVGAGWSLVNIGALRLLHDGVRPPRIALAGHDLCLLAAAAAGALAF